MERKKIKPADFAVRHKVSNRKLSRDRDQRQGKFIFRIFLTLVFIALPTLFLSWQRIKIVHYGYSIEQAKDEASKLRDLNMKLKLERANLTSLKRIERIAVEKLEMITPEVTDVTMVSVEQIQENIVIASGKAPE